MRSFLVAVTLTLLASGVAQAKVAITVDKDNQQMTVAVDGVARYHWPVSSGIPSYETPNGSFRTFRMILAIRRHQDLVHAEEAAHGLDPPVVGRIGAQQHQRDHDRRKYLPAVGVQAKRQQRREHADRADHPDAMILEPIEQLSTRPWLVPTSVVCSRNKGSPLVPAGNIGRGT